MAILCEGIGYSRMGRLRESFVYRVIKSLWPIVKTASDYTHSEEHTGPVSVAFDFEDHVPIRSVMGSDACATVRPAYNSSVDNIGRAIFGYLRAR
jgi:hypothetical protein